jgi:RNA polymerase sigma factor (sigma-70 family)
MSDVINHTVPPEIHESWRAWLMTGARRTPADRRRLRGAHKGLKKILLEGLANGGEHRWQDFSGAMVRHAVDDALRSLPPEETQVVKLAYFGGYSNREIARKVGLKEGTVQRRLRRALDAISDHIQHGQELGRRAAYGLALFLTGRWLGQAAGHVWTATAVASAAVVIVAAQPMPGTVHQHIAAPAAPATQAAQAAQAAQRSGPVVPPMPSPTVPVQLQAPISAPVTLPTVQVPKFKLPPVPVKLKNLL